MWPFSQSRKKFFQEANATVDVNIFLHLVKASTRCRDNTCCGGWLEFKGWCCICCCWGLGEYCGEPCISASWFWVNLTAMELCAFGRRSYRMLS